MCESVMRKSLRILSLVCVYMRFRTNPPANAEVVVFFCCAYILHVRVIESYHLTSLCGIYYTYTCSGYIYTHKLLNQPIREIPMAFILKIFPDTRPAQQLDFSSRRRVQQHVALPFAQAVNLSPLFGQ